MIFNSSYPKRRFFVPEVVQTSAMDCGPASLKALLGGFGIPVNYGRLREACQTDIDGSSIDTIEEIACESGLDAAQIIVPADHLLMPESEALPAIAVVRLPNGLTHFVVVWRIHGNFVQIMDPATGRCWRTKKQLLNELYIHAMPVSEEFAYDWISSESFIHPLRSRLSELGIRKTFIDRLIETAMKNSVWQPIAALDASVRLTATLLRTKGIRTEKEAEQVLEHLFIKTSEVSSSDIYSVIPSSYWSVRVSSGNENQLYICGAVLMNAAGLKQSDTISDEESGSISPKLSASLKEPEIKTEWKNFIFKDHGVFVFAILAAAIILAVIGVTLEAVLLRVLLDMSILASKRTDIALYLYAFFFIMFLIEVSGAASLTEIGRSLEVAFRVSVLEKIPRLGDRFFHSRLPSDMAQRAHELRQLRLIPDMAANCFRTISEMILTTAGIIWLNPQSMGIAITTVLVILGISFMTQPLLKEQDLCFRTHISALSRCYLDALLGLIPIRTHRAEKSVQTEHESLLVKWSDAGMKFYHTHLSIFGIQLFISTGLAILIIFNYVRCGGGAGGVLLLLYWVMKIPVLGENLSNILQQYPMQHNRVLRILEILNSKEETETWYDNHAEDQQDLRHNDFNKGLGISIENVSVNIGGHTVLSNINLKIKPGEHIAIVGPSGAGKSSLAGILLGLYRPASGFVKADNELLHGDRLCRLRRETAWVEPTVQIWNRSVRENIFYGNSKSFSAQAVIQEADLSEIIEKLPQGSDTPLGESGGLVSGGEGQRVRLGRAFMRYGARLAILDEPFRGLDRTRRRELLKRSRNHWHDATMIFISHDISEALTFDRILVIEDGQIVEDDAPNALCAKSDSRYRALLESEEAVRRTLWEGSNWRRWRLENGELIEI